MGSFCLKPGQLSHQIKNSERAVSLNMQLRKISESRKTKVIFHPEIKKKLLEVRDFSISEIALYERPTNLKTVKRSSKNDCW